MLTDDEIRALREKSQYLAGYHGPHEVYPVHRYELHELATRLLSAEARVKVLEEALRPLADACFEDFCSDATEGGEALCTDDEPVAFDGFKTTFGMIRRARTALQEKSK